MTNANSSRSVSGSRLSPIRVRVPACRTPAVIDADWFQHQTRRRRAIPRAARRQHTNGYRLVHGENDGLPARPDRYAGRASSQTLHPRHGSWHTKEFCGALANACIPAQHVMIKTSCPCKSRWMTADSSAMGRRSRFFLPEVDLISENGLTFILSCPRTEDRLLFPLTNVENWRPRGSPYPKGSRC